MTMPAVIHLLPAYNPFPPIYPAGTELRVEQVSLRQQRYRAVVVCGAFDKQALTEQIGSMLIRRIKISAIYRRLFQKITRLDPWPYTDRMWRVIREEQAKILHIHNEPKLLAGLAQHLEKSPMPVVVHIANSKPIPQQAKHLVTRWVACSHFMKHWLAESSGVALDKIDVIYTGVDISKRPPWWAIPAEQRQALRQQHGIMEDDAIVILFAGRLVKEKGVTELLGAFEILRARVNKPLYLLVAGNVRDSADPKNEKAVYGKAVAARMATQAGVKWVGSLAPSAMHEFLLTGDLYALPSIWPDPFPTVMLEAAAAGLPIVGSAQGGIIEFLEGYPGAPVIQDAENPTLWADALEKLVQDDALRLTAGQWLRAKVENSFGWDRVTRDFEALYDRLLAK